MDRPILPPSFSLDVDRGHAHDLCVVLGPGKTQIAILPIPRGTVKLFIKALPDLDRRTRQCKLCRIAP